MKAMSNFSIKFCVGFLDESLKSISRTVPPFHLLQDAAEGEEGGKRRLLTGYGARRLFDQLKRASKKELTLIGNLLSQLFIKASNDNCSQNVGISELRIERYDFSCYNMKSRYALWIISNQSYKPFIVMRDINIPIKSAFVILVARNRTKR